MCWNLHRMQHICSRYATKILICIGHFSVETLGNVLFCAFLQAVHLLVNIGWECLRSQTHIRRQIQRASGKLVLVKSVRRTCSHRMKFCVQRGLGALPSTSFTHRLNSFQISWIVLLVLSQSPAYGARGFYALLTDSCNKASSSE